MTREEAKEFIAQSVKNDVDMAKVAEAIKALEQEPTTKIEESNFSQEQYLADIQSAYDCGKSVIDKIRAEIEDLIDCPYDKCKGSDCVFCLQDECTVRGYRLMDILDKYKAENNS